MPTTRSLQHALLPTLLTVLLQGCASAPPSSPPVVIQVSVPPLPSQARQPPAPALCSAGCSKGLTNQRRSLLGTLTPPERPDSPASGPTMP